MTDGLTARAVRRAIALVFAAALSIAPAAADVTYSSKAMPATEELSAAKSDLGARLGGLLGPDAPEVRTRRGAGLRSALGLSRAPDAAGPEIAYTLDFVDARPEADGDAQWTCLTEALYFEARGETVKGVFAVAEVILNRVDSAAFPDTICGVVNQGTGRLHGCQFSYNCDGRAETVNERGAWTRMGKIAALMIEKAPRTLTGGAMFYHTKAVSPRWSRVFDRTTTIGAHHFYAKG